MKIGLDIDGVIYPWHYSIYRYFTEYKGYTEDESTFWGRDRHLITEYEVSIPICYLDQTPTPDVIEYIPKIAELGEIYYITSRNSDLLWATQKFFNIYELPFKENLIFSKEKATYVRLLHLDYFLDDMPAFIDSISGLTDAYLFKAVHNREVRENYRVINTMKEFYELLKGKNGR